MKRVLTDRDREINRLRLRRRDLAGLALDPHLTPDPAERTAYKRELDAVVDRLLALGVRR